MRQDNTLDELSYLRQEIDKIDDAIWALLEKRFQLLESVAAVKRQLNIPVLDPKREQQVLARIEALSSSKEVNTAIMKIYEVLFELSRRHQG